MPMLAFLLLLLVAVAGCCYFLWLVVVSCCGWLLLFYFCDKDKTVYLMVLKCALNNICNTVMSGQGPSSSGGPLWSVRKKPGRCTFDFPVQTYPNLC